MDWISVKDKLPDIGEVVLVANDYTVSTAYMNENKVFESEDYSFIYVNKVKYWMPYPKAPKEEKKMTRFDKFKSELTLEKLAELYTRKCKCEVCARQYNDTCDYNCVFDIGEDYCTEGVKQYFREEIKNENSKENM